MIFQNVSRQNTRFKNSQNIHFKFVSASRPNFSVEFNVSFLILMLCVHRYINVE